MNEKIRKGRPMVTLFIKGKPVQVFIDTGSELSLIKEECLSKFKLKGRPNTRRLQGVTGTEMKSDLECHIKFFVADHLHCTHRVATINGLSFPGEVLVGMDFLRRMNFKLVCFNEPKRSYLSLQGVRLPVTFTDDLSLQVRAIADVGEIAELQEKMPDEGYRIHALRSVVCPPRTGMFIRARMPRQFNGNDVCLTGVPGKVIVPKSVCSVHNHNTHVWVVNADTRPQRIKNGTCLAMGEEITEIVSKDAETTPHYNSTITDSDSLKMPETEESMASMTVPPPTNNADVPDPLPELEVDEFDQSYGLLDFGYGTDEYMVFPDVDLSPSPVCVTNNVEDAIKKVITEDCTREASNPIEGISIDHLKAKQAEQLLEVLNRYPSLFADDVPIGTVPNIEHHIVTTQTEPIRNRQWRLPETSRAVIKEECQKMLRDGVIEPSSSPWLSPVVLVKKKDNSVRFCVDYRGLNAVTVADAYPMPRMEELIDELHGTSWFTALDARSAYWAIRVNREDRPKTAFTDGHRLFQFKRLPFGLATAPTTFQRSINCILSSVLGRHTICYLDDVVVHSKTFSDHLQHLDETLALLAKAGFKLNIGKCDFAKNTFKFLGFLITPEGIKPDPEKVKAIDAMPPPRTPKGIRRFLGCTGFFRKHIKSYAAIASPLTRLTKKYAKFSWKEEQDKAFKALKDALTSEPVLRKPDYEKEFEVHSDASQVAIGACLMQRDGHGIPYAIAYYSRKLRDAELRYPTIDTEALAVVEAVRVFDPYLYGRSFIIYTDHRPLTYVFHRKTKSLRMTRWSHELSFYNYRLRYKPGAAHQVPDCLSRDVAAITAPTLDPTEVREAQLQDPLWRELMQYLEERGLPRRKLPLPVEEFEIKDGVLYHVRHMPDKLIHQLVIPQALRQTALKIAHSSRFAAHPGAYRTYQRLRDLMYFPNMLRVTQEYVKSCLVCQKRKGAAYKQAPMASAPPAQQPLEKVSADLLDLHQSESGNRYVLVIIDNMTRYLQLVALPCKNAETVANALIDNFITIFGPPRIIQTDNGAEFNNALFRQVCQIIRAKTSLTTAFHPQANGMVERSNRVVKDALATLTETHPARWDELLPHVRLALNSAIHRSVGEQPLYLMTGYHGLFPLGLANDQIVAEGSAHRFQERLKVARQVAIETSNKAREQWARGYNKKVHRSFSPTVGTLILWRETTHIGKGPAKSLARSLGNKWTGPARITKKTGPVTFIAQQLAHPYKERKLHVNQMKAYVQMGELDMVGDEDPRGLDIASEQGDGDEPDDPLATMLLSAIRPPTE